MLSFAGSLLSKNNQFGSKKRFNHEALALYLQHSLKPDCEQRFVLAGSEDLRAILPTLDLNQEGAEAFMLVRPYIHSMGLYFCYQGGKLYALLFDSQNWGTRYYPTRLILNAITQSFPEAQVLLTNCELQLQSVQEGCTEYSLFFLDYCSKQGMQLITSFLSNLTPLDEKKYSNCYTVGLNNLPEVFLAIHMQKQRDWYWHAFSENITRLEKIIGANYLTAEDRLDDDKVRETVLTQQGYYRVKQNPFTELYLINFNIDTKQLVIQLPHENFLYSNFLFHSNNLYPSTVDLSNSKFLLKDIPGIQVTYEKETCRLIYSAEKLSILKNAFEDLSAETLYTQHMRQQTALATLKDTVEAAIELNMICRKGRGGFEIRQVQLALAYFFRDKPDVYVPSMEKLSVGLSLQTLKELEYRALVFSFQLDNYHQIGVWVDLSEENKVSIYNSYDPEGKNVLLPEALKRLTDFLGDECSIMPASFPYAAQQDAWSCGVYTIANLFWKENKTAFIQGMPLDVAKLAKDYYRAYKLQEQIEQQQQEDYAAEEKIKHDLMKLLKKYSGFTEPLREYLQHNNHNITTLALALKYYTEQPVSDKIGILILQVALILKIQRLDQPQQKLKNLFSIIQNDRGTNENSQGAKKVQGTLGFLKLEFPASYLKQLLTLINNLLNFPVTHVGLVNLMLCMAYDDEYIKGIQGILPSEPYLSSVFLELIRYAADGICNAKANHSTAVRRIECEKAVKLQEKMQLYSSLQIELPTTLYEQLCENFIKFQFIKSLVRDSYFNDFSIQEKLKFFENLSDIKIFSSYDICTEIEFFPAAEEKFLAYLLKNPKKLDALSETNIRLESVFNLFDKHFGNHLGLSCIIKYKDKIQNISHLAVVLRALPEADRIAFALENKGKIQDGSHLAVVLRALPEADRIAFVLENEGKIQNGSQLAVVLMALPEADRIAFALENKGKIQNGSQLAVVLMALLEADRVAFALENEGKIQNGSQLAVVLMALLEADRVAFALENKGKIQNDSQLAEVFKALPEKNRVEFAIKYKNNIRNGHRLAMILGLLPEEERLQFVRENKDKIQDGLQLAKVLRTLPEVDRVVFTCENKDKIQNGSQLAKVLKALLKVSRFAFARENKDKIQNGSQLAKVLKALPKASRAEFARENKDKIQDDLQLAKVLKVLSEESCVAFAFENKDKIQNGSQLFDVLKILPEKIRLKFALENKDKIQDGSLQLVMILNLLSEEERFVFALENKNKIQDGSQLLEVLRILLEKSRLKFALENKDKVQSDRHFPLIFRLLPEEDRLQFALENKGKVQDGSQLLEILKVLPKGSCLKFALENKGKIQNDWYFHLIFRLLPEEDHLQFARENKDKIQNSSQLVKVLEILPKEHRFDLILALEYNGKFQDDFQASEVGKLLSEEEYSRFVNLKFDDINYVEKENQIRTEILNTADLQSRATTTYHFDFFKPQIEANNGEKKETLDNLKKGMSK